MKKILYILGAGFSAPMGLPVMSNFISKSKDIFASDSKKYSHFEEIYKHINRLSRSKLYLRTDLHNIEEILSNLEMESFISGKPLADHFHKYIADVIKFYTPSIAPGRIDSGLWPNEIFGQNPLFLKYGRFVSGVANWEFITNGSPSAPQPMTEPLYVGIKGANQECYAVISLNYDLIIESFFDCVKTHYYVDGKICISTKLGKNNECYANNGTLYLAKIHGSIEPLNIIPPTWNKTNA
ncbi:MAG TPA: hypothetical protein VK737_03700, partial [Opitutales bacterium]|nr:hypothetical protein [Opitutales bacterium]